MNDKLKVTLTEGITKSGLRVFLSEINPHSEEYKGYTVTLVENGKQFICGQKGVYKNIVSAKKILNQVIMSC